METYRSGQAGDYGLYVSIKPPDVRFIGAKGEPIQGRDDAAYYHIPTLLTLPGALTLAVMFVMAFPLMVFYASFTAIAGKSTPQAKAAPDRFKAQPGYLDQNGNDGSSGKPADPKA